MIVFHICRRSEFDAARPAYRAASLASEGFIHCSTAEQVTGVAGALFQGFDDLVLLAIETGDLDAAVRWEVVEDQTFPHVYGPIPVRAVREVIGFPPRADGSFELPSRAAALAAR